MKSLKVNIFRAIPQGTVGLGIAWLCALLTGCATGAKSEAMVPAHLSLSHQHPSSVSLRVLGGAETNPMWTPEISATAFEEALHKAIVDHKSFSSVLQGQAGTYQLQVQLLDLDQPGMGFNMTVRLITQWTLTRTKDQKRVFDHRVQGQHTATVGDAFAGVTRLRLANEGAARDTLRQGLIKISQLSLSP